MASPRRVALMLELGKSDYWHAELFAGTQRYARESGNWDCHIDEFVQDRLPSRRGRNVPYDGIIAWATPELAEGARRCGVPLVNVLFNSQVTNLPSVFPNLGALGRLAAEHLLQCGYRRFGCLSMQRVVSQRLQLEEFKAAVTARGFECSAATTIGSYVDNTTSRKWDAFERRIEKWVDSLTPPVGIFVSHFDFTARQVVRFCQRRGLQVPQDVGLVSGDSEQAILCDPPPSLTSIHVSYEEVGYRAAEMLDRLMDGRPVSKRHLLLEPTGVVPRQTTGYVHSEDEVVVAALRYMSTQAHRSIGVGDVASNVFVSRRTLERRFSDSLGRSVASEIRRLRIERAKHLLRDTGLSLSAVAFQSGFRSAQGLCEIFQREEGIAPSQFRREVSEPRTR
ncbi:MAG: substrate-binding domain-containing protein [Fuerstiella sp.]